MRKYSFTTFSKITDPAAAKVVYIHGGGDDRDEIISRIEGENFALVFVQDLNWNDDTTPWPAKGVFGGGDFGGKADEYLPILIEEIIPEAEGQLGLNSPQRGIAGYSLGGLLAVYSLFRSNTFSLAASVSGSLWYDGFVDFVKDNLDDMKAERLYFSLGDREKKTRNPRMAAVEQATEEISTMFSEGCPHVKFELNPGNHFMDAGKRLAAGINYILK